MDAIRAFEATYLGTQTRAAQDNEMAYKCWMSSLSKTGKDKVQIWEEEYTVNGTRSANLLFKVILRESHIETAATSASIRYQLSKLDEYISSVGQDITKFNAYVKLMVEGLNARGESSSDLLINLFKGYLACSDKEFVSYINLSMTSTRMVNPSPSTLS